VAGFIVFLEWQMHQADLQEQGVGTGGIRGVWPTKFCF